MKGIRGSVRFAALAVLAAVAIGVATRTTEQSAAFESRRLVSDPSGGGDATIAPDGTHFITSSSRSGNVDLWAYDIGSGAWSQLTDDPADDFEGRWSPDGARIVFTSTRAGDKDVWVLDLATRKTVRLTDSPDEEEYPVWSPDGRWIVYTGGPWNARDFFIVAASGGQARRLTRSSGRAGACAFEPGGDSLVCHRYDSGRGQVVRLWLDGEEAPITGGPSWDYKPAASPDGRSIAFSRSVEGPSQIWLATTATGRATQLVRSAFDDRWPTWDASGRLLLFHRIVDEGTGVFLLDRRSGVRRELVGADERPRQASIDPAMRLLAYCAQAGDRLEVRVRDLRAGTVRTIDTGRREACYPRWSPGGDALAMTVRGATRWEIATVDGDGNGLRLLTEAHRQLRGLDGTIDWSPDGRRLIFQADTEPFEARLFAIDRETGALEALTSPGFFDESPAWTRDGRHIVFMSTRGGNWTWSLVKLSPATGELTSLAGPDWVEKNFPRMSRAGELLWSSRDGRGVERLIERSGASERRIDGVGEGARWPSYSNDDKWIVWTAMRREVEYWIARNPRGAGSPARAGSKVAMPDAVVEPPRAAAGCASPRDLHRR